MHSGIVDWPCLAEWVCWRTLRRALVFEVYSSRGSYTNGVENICTSITRYLTRQQNEGFFKRSLMSMLACYNSNFLDSLRHFDFCYYQLSRVFLRLEILEKGASGISSEMDPGDILTPLRYPAISKSFLYTQLQDNSVPKSL